jgi:hypothetical protein
MAELWGNISQRFDIKSVKQERITRKKTYGYQGEMKERAQ